MRIVAIVERAWIGQAPSGGAERMIHILMSHLASQGWEAVGIVTNGLPFDQVIDGVRVVATQDKNKVYELAKGANIVISHLAGTPRARITARNLKLPFVQLIHNTSDYTVGFLGDGCDLAIYNTEWVRDFHESHKAVPLIKSWQDYQHTELRYRTCFEWPSTVIRPPVVDPTHKTSTGDKITLVNLTPNKGPDMLYALADRNPDLNFMGVIGGYEADKQVIERHRNVEIMPFTHDIDKIYSRSRVMLMPSKYESYGFIAVEAAQYGIPTIASDTPGLRECLGPQAIIRDREDVDAWDKALHHTIEYYDGASRLARLRHDHLYQQSITELAEFTKVMEAVGNGTVGDRGSRGSVQSGDCC